MHLEEVQDWKTIGTFWSPFPTLSMWPLISSLLQTTASNEHARIYQAVAFGSLFYLLISDLCFSYYNLQHYPFCSRREIAHSCPQFFCVKKLRTWILFTLRVCGFLDSKTGFNKVVCKLKSSRKTTCEKSRNRLLRFFHLRNRKHQASFSPWSHL